MSGTEDDLRALLEERGADGIGGIGGGGGGGGGRNTGVGGGGGGGGGTARLEAILARGRAIRRRRTAATAAAVLAAGALAVAVVAPSLTARGGGGGEAPIVAVAADPTPVPTATSPAPGTDLPATLSGLRHRDEMRLIRAYRSKIMGAEHVVRFTPTSVFTGFRVVCEDPRAVVVLLSGAGKHRSGSVGECGRVGGGGNAPGVTTQYDEKSVSPGWTSQEQSLTIWVLPPRPRISREAMKKLKCPEKEIEKTGMCDGQYVNWALIGPRMETRVLERVTAKVGTEPGRWAIGVYDRPSS